MVSTMCQKSKEDTYVSWVEPEISTTVFIFAGEDGLEWAFLDFDPSSN